MKKNKINIISSLNKLKEMQGQELGTSTWFYVDQNKINSFANATNDHQWIHVDKEKAKRESPFKNTIAHGYFTLSLIPMFVDQIWKCKNISSTLNYGSDKIRFISPVVCGSKIRAKIYLISAVDYREGVKIKCKIEIEILDSKKLAMSAETIALLFPK